MTASQGARGATCIVTLVTLLLCAPWMIAFEARVTDLSALRDGSVYRIKLHHKTGRFEQVKPD